MGYIFKNTMFGSDLFEANYPRFLTMQLNAEGYIWEEIKGSFVHSFSNFERNFSNPQ